MLAASEYTKYIPNIFCTKYIYIPNIYTKNIPYMLYTSINCLVSKYIPSLIWGVVACRRLRRSRQGWSPPGVSQHRQLGSTQGAFAQADGRRDVRRPRWWWLVGWLVGWLVICPLGGCLSVIDFICRNWDFGTMYVKSDEVINVCSSQIIDWSDHELKSSNAELIKYNQMIGFAPSLTFHNETKQLRYINSVHQWELTEFSWVQHRASK